MKTLSKLTLIAAVCCLFSCKQNPAETPEHIAMVENHEKMEAAHEAMKELHEQMKDDHEDMMNAHKTLENDTTHIAIEENQKIF